MSIRHVGFAVMKKSSNSQTDLSRSCLTAEKARPSLGGPRDKSQGGNPQNPGMASTKISPVKAFYGHMRLRSRSYKVVCRDDERQKI